MSQFLKLVPIAFLLFAANAPAQTYSLEEICNHYTDSKGNCARVPFCRYMEGGGFCEKISAPSSPYACQIFNTDANACDKYTFGNCRWNEGQPKCIATRQTL